MIDSFVVTAKIREQNLLLFLPIMAWRYKRYFIYGIRAQLEALGPTWAKRKVNKFH